MSVETLLAEDLKQLISKKCNEEQFSCKDCGKSYTLKENFKRHLRGRFPGENCSEKKLNKLCEICKERFLYSRSLEIHMYTHSGITLFKCTTCHKDFKKPYLLTKHMKFHLTREVECVICNSSFLNENDKIVHMRIHTGEKPYVCPDCPYKSTQKSNLRTHSIVHSGKKPAVCKKCKKSFTTVSYLKIHMRSH